MDFYINEMRADNYWMKAVVYLEDTNFLFLTLPKKVSQYLAYYQYPLDCSVWISSSIGVSYSPHGAKLPVHQETIRYRDLLTVTTAPLSTRGPTDKQLPTNFIPETDRQIDYVRDRLALIVKELSRYEAFDPLFREGFTYPFDLAVCADWLEERGYRATELRTLNRLGVSRRTRTGWE